VHVRAAPGPECSLVASLRGSAGYNGKAADANETDVGIYLRNEAAQRGAQAIVLTSRRTGAATDGDTLSQPRGSSVSGGCPNCIAITADAYRCERAATKALPKPIAPPSATASDPPFSQAAADAALEAASRGARACVPAGAAGDATALDVSVTFATTGDVVYAEVVRGGVAGTGLGDCIARKFRNAHLPPFSGEARSITTTVRLGP
jgi:hypothetical protein